MRLISCNVTAFGTLKDFSCDFGEGLNTIKQDNGWGKSTLSVFIKAVFYGLANGNKHSLEENERLKYRPWNSTEKFGGSIVFEWKDKEYKLERFFGSKSSEDTVRVFDVDTGKEFPDTENLGKRIFGIDEEGFSSTVFLAQKDFEAKSNASITAKYNEVCEIQDPEKFNKAVNYLEEKAKTYKSSRGDKGLIADAKREIFDIGGRLDRAARAAETAKKMTEEAEELEKDIETLKVEDAKLRKLSEKAGRAEAVAVKKARYKKVGEEKEAQLAEIERADKVLCGKDVGEERLKMLRDCISELNFARSEKTKLSAELLEAERAEKLRAEKLREEKSLADKAHRGGKLSVSFILAIIFLSAGLIAVAAGLITKIMLLAIVGGVLFVGGVISLIISVSNANASRKKLPEEEPETEEKPILNDELIEKRRTFEEFSEIEKEYEKRISEFFSAFELPQNADVFTAYSLVEKAAADKRRAKATVEALSAEIAALEKDGAIFEKIEGALNAQAINKELATVGEWYKNKTVLLAKTKAAISAYEKEADESADLEGRKAELTDKIAEYEKDYDLTVTTLKYLKEADENLKVKYRKPLAESLNKYLALINGESLHADIDVDLKVSVTGGGFARDTEYFSKGYKNLFEICKRFALTDVLFTAEKPFIVLDDPFCNLDDKKIRAATELLNKLGEEYQILYFICHESRRAKPDSAT